SSQYINNLISATFLNKKYTQYLDQQFWKEKSFLDNITDKLTNHIVDLSNLNSINTYICIKLKNMLFLLEELIKNIQKGKLLLLLLFFEETFIQQIINHLLMMQIQNQKQIDYIDLYFQLLLIFKYRNYQNKHIM
ncbi:hypothetical protein IMG5_072430, partial [Ichthyophthirius multifiliis]